MDNARVLAGAKVVARPHSAGKEEAVPLQTFRLDPRLERFLRLN